MTLSCIRCNLKQIWPSKLNAAKCVRSAWKYYMVSVGYSMRFTVPYNSEHLLTLDKVRAETNVAYSKYKYKHND